MMFKKRISLYLIGWTLSFYSCLGQNNKLVFIPITLINSIDTTTSGGMRSINKESSYLIQNYTESNQSLKEIHAFIEKNKDANYREFGTYSILIYKQSWKTNIANITANKRVIDRYSFDHDLIFVYKWMDGKFLSFHKFKNGEIVNPTGKIQVIDVP